jgi:hypothetical protein
MTAGAGDLGAGMRDLHVRNENEPNGTIRDAQLERAVRPDIPIVGRRCCKSERAHSAEGDAPKRSWAVARHRSD